MTWPFENNTNGQESGKEKFKKRKTKKYHGNNIGSFSRFFNQSFWFGWSFTDANRKEESDRYLRSNLCTGR